MSFDQDRIRLAEAMGIRGVEGVKQHGPHAGWFDPFTSASDDYRVLLWARDHGFSKRTKFLHEVGEILQVQGEFRVAWPDAIQFYQPGVYALAALRALINDD